MLAEAVIFDLDDTLVAEKGIPSVSLRRVAEEIGGIDPDRFAEAVLETARRRWQAGPYHRRCVELGIASWEALWASFEGAHPSLAGLVAWCVDYRATVWRDSLCHIGLHDPSLIAFASQAFIAHQRAGHPLVDGALQVVEALRGNRCLGVLTNGPPDIQRSKLESVGLLGHFDTVVVSGEVGVGKPDPAGFALVLENLGVGAGQALMVGDSWERDILGARGVGMAAAWISPQDPAPAPRPGVAVITGLEDLLGLLS